MIAANSVTSGVSCVPPPCGRTFDGGISGSAISYRPSGAIQLHVRRPTHSPTSDHHIDTVRKPGQGLGQAPPPGPRPVKGQLTGPNPTERGKKDQKSTSSWTASACPCRSASPPPPSMTVGLSSRLSAAFRPSVRVEARDVDGPASYMATSATTTATCGNDSLPAGTVSPVKASSRPNAWVDAAGPWSGPCAAAAASTAFTSASRTLPRLHHHRRGPHMSSPPYQVKWRPRGRPWVFGYALTLVASEPFPTSSLYCSSAC